MDEAGFLVLLPLITADIVDKMMKKYKMEEDNALIEFSKSQIFSNLSDEKTKVWQYSSDMVLELYDRELNGNLYFPEV